MKKIKYKTMTIRIPVEEWKLVRNYAFQKETSMREVISQAINCFLK